MTVTLNNKNYLKTLGGIQIVIHRLGGFTQIAAGANQASEVVGGNFAPGSFSDPSTFIFCTSKVGNVWTAADGIVTVAFDGNVVVVGRQLAPAAVRTVEWDVAIIYVGN